MRAELDLKTVAGLLVGAFGLTLVPGLAAVPAIIGTALLVLVLPGLLLSLVLFSGRELPGPERAVLAIGSSIAITVLAGLALNLIAPLNSDTWRVAMGAICVALLVAGAIRANLTSARPPAGTWPSSAASLQIAAAAVVAVLICAAAIWLARVSAERVPAPGFTELSLVRSADGAPTTVQLLVNSREASPVEFDVSVGGLPGSRRWEFTLQPGEQFAQTLAAPEDATVVASLSRRGEAEVYRRTELKPPVATIPE